MNARPRRERLRAQLAGPGCVFPASVFDPISARIAQNLGYEAGMLAGSVASLAVLGAPDLGLITLSELAALAHRIGRAADLPLIVDADHGYGNALNVARTVEELETAGVAALSIEDTLLPPAFGRAKETLLIPLEEGVGKMRAAVAARQEPGLVILARTGAPAVTGLADAILRCRAYLATGVDGLFVTGLRSLAELGEISAALPSPPLMLGQVKGDLADREALGRAGVRLALQGHVPFLAAVGAVERSMAALREGTAPEAVAGAATPALMRRLTREEAYGRSLDELS